MNTKTTQPVTYFHASDHLFAAGDTVLPGRVVGKVGYSGGARPYSDLVWCQDDVYGINKYGSHVYEVRPVDVVTEYRPHLFAASSAVIVREVDSKNGPESVDLDYRLLRAAMASGAASSWFRGSTRVPGLVPLRP